MRVTLLGTGCPIADVHRYGPATLVEAGGEAWLVDCGSGVTQRLLAHGLNGARITGLLLTHLHSDHTVDFIQLLISGWHQGRSTPLKVYGRVLPGPSLRDSCTPGNRSFSNAWPMNSALPPGYKQRSPKSMAPGVWRLNICASPIPKCPISPVQAFAFRFDASGDSAAISGDTAYSPELKPGAGCDLLVHEAFVHWQYDLVRRHATQSNAAISAHTIPPQRKWVG